MIGALQAIGYSIAILFSTVAFIILSFYLFALGMFINDEYFY